MDAGTSRFQYSGSSVMAQNNGFGNGRLIPQFFTSAPTLNGAASYLAETTSYITSCFPDFTDQSARADGMRNEQETLSLASEQTSESPSLGHCSNRIPGSDAAVSVSAITPDAPQSYDDIRRDAADESPANAGALLQSTSATTSPSGISLFQGYASSGRWN